MLHLQDGERFLSDLGTERRVVIAGQAERLGRYAVMESRPSKNQLRVLEVSADREYLLRKYHIAPTNIGRLTP